jgi:TRAP-type C4-dicarboxylate transport system permease small subunit
MALLIARIRRGCELAAAAMFAAMFCSFLIGVVARYVFDNPVSWSIEVCSIAYVWIVFFASSTFVTQKQHITFDMLYASVGSRAKRVFALISAVSILGVYLASLPATLDYIAFVGNKRTLTLHLPLDLVYGCFGIFAVMTVLLAAIRLRRLLGRDWQSNI